MTATPVHDHLVLWLDSQMDNLLPDIKAQARAICCARLSDVRRDSDLGLVESAGVEDMLEDWSAAVVTKKVWEFQVAAGSNRIEGSIDLLVVLDLIDRHRLRKLRCSNPNGYALRIAFEVKPKIESLGELIRQVRRYQFYMRDTVFFVASPDQRYAALLREQGIGFIPLGPAQGGLLDA